LFQQTLDNGQWTVDNEQLGNLSNYQLSTINYQLK
ncbi:MAG TPA: N-(5'-phosphoribosyl)anthranilate isomerase, partial [Cyanobacteria bacterium UBA9226]|nr:N-(5'-phosphoribosyl)anthranilate isomerase [Cyanobacteria bacterium UBA9226]